jgi:predicted nucleic acid-binding protein
MNRSATRSARRAAGRRSAPKGTITTFVYIETSALLAALLEKDHAARSSLRVKRGRRMTSALTFAEASRALVRARVAGRITPVDERAALRWLQTFRRRCDVVAVTDAVLARAGRPFTAEPVRTLDGIHLATAELLGEPPQLITIVTRDTRIIENAKALRYVVD